MPEVKDVWTEEEQAILAEQVGKKTQSWALLDASQGRGKFLAKMLKEHLEKVLPDLHFHQEYLLKFVSECIFSITIKRIILGVIFSISVTRNYQLCNSRSNPQFFVSPSYKNCIFITI
jgi:hypothetical protein